MMAKQLLYFGLTCAAFSTALSSTILTSSSDIDYYLMTAVVVFNATTPGTEKWHEIRYDGESEDMGRYGRSSPHKNISGVVRLPEYSNDHYYGCTDPYGDVDTSGQWIALVERGDCTFSEKIKAAKSANASGIIVYDNSDYGPTIMRHDGEDDIVAVSIPRSPGLEAVKRLEDGNIVRAGISLGKPFMDPEGRRNRTSIIFVSLSFLILMVISLTWLIVYYVQRFRIVHSPELIKRRAMARRIITNLPKKTLSEGDKELVSEDICPICIETYKVEEILRILPCQHIFHRKCVDPWLKLKETCPMCKFDILKSRELSSSSSYDRNLLFGARSPPVVEVWEPVEARTDVIASTSTDSLVPNHQESIIRAVVEGDDGPASQDLPSPSNSDNPDAIETVGVGPSSLNENS